MDRPRIPLALGRKPNALPCEEATLLGVRSARGHTELCIKVIAGIVSQEAVPPAARVSPAGGWGRAYISRRQGRRRSQGYEQIGLHNNLAASGIANIERDAPPPL